jgi:molybdopterin synthase sulfur carrier subunit
MSTVTLLYFARLREAFGVASEDFSLPAGCATAGDLVRALQSRGGAWAQELATGRPYRLAVNQEMAHVDAPLHAGDEVAIFPPVTGG